MFQSQLDNAAEVRGATKLSPELNGRLYGIGNLRVWPVILQGATKTEWSNCMAWQSAFLIDGRYSEHQAYPYDLEGFRCALDRQNRYAEEPEPVEGDSAFVRFAKRYNANLKAAGINPQDF